ncbi:DUF6274 family protein [Streptomyces sp. XM4193]|uniref:DUF6274 family protein n=1 Tax=Streptomyces sp. XM4193 TaxID=2929782 RepID=UPI001FF721FD|nr:DUF6274 family protein [Streptomyces sp. XM4193]MCK1794981.1 DUF6274 family protein [Streptomyces sp. XM4193]
MATARGPRQHRRHSTKALLRAHLSAAARLGPHSTPRCAVCHRLRRLAAEHPAEPHGSAVPFVPAVAPAPSARSVATDRDPEPAPREPGPPVDPGTGPRESAPRESGPRESGPHASGAGESAGAAQRALPAGKSESTEPREPVQQPAATRGPAALGAESGARDRRSGSLADSVPFAAPHPSNAAPLTEIPAVHPIRPPVPALASSRGADDATTAEAVTAAVRAAHEPHGSRGA